MKYPIKRKQHNSVANYSNLGMTLESDIDQSNNYYLINDIAVIHKKPTPVQVVNVSYPARNKAKITEAYYKTASTTDYNGIYKGKYLDFDAKETNSKTSFPLSNIHKHQIDHLEAVLNHGGIAFLIIHWKQYNKYFYVPIEVILPFWKNKEDGRKSIPYQTFLNETYEISFTYNPRLDYLKVINKLHFNL